MSEPLICDRHPGIGDRVHLDGQCPLDRRPASPTQRQQALTHWLRAGEVYFRDATEAEAQFLAQELDRLWREWPNVIERALQVKREYLPVLDGAPGEIIAVAGHICIFCGQGVRGGHCGCV